MLWMFLLLGGDLDPSFAENGQLLLRIRNHTAFHDVTFLPSGQILVAGFSQTTSEGNDFLVTRLNSDGSVDTTFASQGSAIWGTANPEDAYSLVVLPDNSIVAGGQGSSRFMMAGFTPNGATNLSFGTNGVVNTRFGFSEAHGNQFLSQGTKILAVGGYKSTANSEWVPFLARFHADGNLDTSFGNQGTGRTTLPGEDIDATASCLAQASDGTIYIGVLDDYQSNSQDIRISKCDANGLNRKSVRSLSFLDRAHLAGLATYHNGLILFGSISRADGSKGFIGKLDLDGEWDPHFGINGLLEIESHPYTSINTAAFYGGWIYAAGSSGNSEHQNLMLWRFFFNGQLDTTFADTGVRALDIDQPEHFNQLRFHSNGKLVGVGRTTLNNTNFPIGSVHRFLAPPQPFLDFGNWPHSLTVLTLASDVNWMP